MKKILSLITVITILLSTAVSAENEGFYSDLTPDNPCYDHVSRLTDFGLIAGYDDGTFKPDNYVTRAETAKLACVASNEGLLESGVIEPFYSDVQTSHWAYKYIVKVRDLGVVSGYDDGTFRPNDTITYNEYVKIFVCTLGYESVAQKKGGYPNGYIELAKEMKLTDGMEFEGDDIVIRANAFIIMDRALDVPLYRLDGYERDENGQWVPTYTVTNGEGKWYQTLLTSRHNIYTVTGTVGKNEDMPVETTKPTEEKRTWEIYNGGKIDEYEFEQAIVLEYPTLYSLPTKYMTADGIVDVVPLGEGNSRITVIFDEDNIDGLYLTLYDVTDDRYVLSKECVKLTSKEYTMENLTGGHIYKVKVSSTEERTVDGKIIVE